MLNFVSNKSPRAESLIDGQPSVIIRDGALLHENLARNRLTVSEVESEMRLAGIAHVAQVGWGILETNGKISFIEAKDMPAGPPREDADNPTS